MNFSYSIRHSCACARREWFEKSRQYFGSLLLTVCEVENIMGL